MCPIGLGLDHPGVDNAKTKIFDCYFDIVYTSGFQPMCCKRFLSVLQKLFKKHYLIAPQPFLVDTTV